MALLGTAAIINDASKRHLDTKTDAETKHKELHTYIDTKVKALEEQNLNIQHLILTCAVSTMKGFQGDTSEIEGFVKGVEMFEKKMECIRTGKCVQ
ncbi:hypothetical protein B9Z19DRAFT_1088427 [Tuber borchii]|uniref:Uncharacterized protein n=1 Tax=Tuber borchii TaxID=42251 RepID=A0A2T6ZLQ3_TUBBO|nr:hypothetical protein B9Z19DRAFT_1088427 [Tuber borchii]